MSPSIAIDKQTKIWLSIILSAALLLRIFHLDYQSLWLDELYTAKEVGPDVSWEEMFGYLRQTDQHPPLYYIITKIFVLLFGHSSFILRLPSALAGTLSVWAIFLLGKEMLNTRVGLIAAAITAVNFFNIQYSQEARGYIITFLFAVYSFLYLIRLLKHQSIKNSVLYGIVTLAFLYTHYFSIFAAFSQAIVVIVFFFNVPKQERWQYAKHFLISAAIVIIGYLPWIPYLQYINNIQRFWIAATRDTFMSDYFYNYFGNTGLLNPFLTAFLMIFIFRLITKRHDKTKRITDQPLTMSFVLAAIWIPGTYIIPYLRSELMFPILITRYTIMVLPAYLIITAAGASLISNQVVRAMALVLFLLLSMVDIIAVKKHYHTISKAQYREMSNAIMHYNSENYPIVEEMYGWQHSYYFNLKNQHPTFISTKRDKAVDSFMQLVNTPQVVQGFWLADGHEKDVLSMSSRTFLETAYIPAVSKTFFEANATLYYLFKTNDSNTRFITYRDVPAQAVYSADNAIALWNNEPVKMPSILLNEGIYNVTVSARGTDALDTFAKVQLYMNNKPLLAFQTTMDLDLYTTNIHIPKTMLITFQAALTNDYQQPELQRDRDAFIKFIQIKKQEPNNATRQSHR